MSIEELLNKYFPKPPQHRWTLDHFVWDTLCDRERPPALCWGYPGWGSCVCTHVHPFSSWEHWEWCGGFNLLWSLRMKWGTSPGCCAALQAEPQPFWAPAQTKHRAVYDNRKRTVDLVCQVRPSSWAQNRESASHLGFLVSWWSIVQSLETVHNPAHHCAGIAEGKTEKPGNAEALSDTQRSSPTAQTP